MTKFDVRMWYLLVKSVFPVPKLHVRVQNVRFWGSDFPMCFQRVISDEHDKVRGRTFLDYIILEWKTRGFGRIGWLMMVSYVLRSGMEVYILQYFSMSILKMILWTHIWWLTQGLPGKIFDLGGVVIGDNQGLTTWCPWDVQNVFKEGWK